MSAAVWIAGATVSLAFHAALAAMVADAVFPEPVEPQTTPESHLVLAAYEVRRDEAIATEPERETAPEGRADPTALGQDAIPRVAALPQPARSEPAAARPVSAPVAPPQRSESATLAAALPRAQAATALPPDDLPLAAARPEATPATRRDAPAAALLAARPEAALAPRRDAPAEALLAAGPEPVAATAAIPDPVLVSAGAPAAAALVPKPAVARLTEARQPAAPRVTGVAPDAGPAMTAAPPAAPRSDPVLPPSTDVARSDPAAAAAAALAAPSVPATETGAAALADTVPQAVAPATAVTASLAWSGQGEAVVDPVSLAAIQAFMTESDLARSRLAAGSVRDGIAGTLAEVPCARLQAEFIPESGVLELRGHIPEEALRGPVLAALRAQVGSSIPVTDNLLILPRPQCGALAGIAALGLPQSTDQETDARLVGENAHARLYRYVGGEQVEFGLTAPDYDAWVYVDFFDAEGMVIHLIPSLQAGLQRYPAKSEITIGPDARDDVVLDMTVGPPFGQEIAAAFAASAPLYDGLRPAVEPAEPYLEWLAARVGAVRAEQPGFKGEWVYFFVATAGQ